MMSLEQLERRVSDLERQFAELLSSVNKGKRPAGVQETFGMFADDDGFDEVVRLGREYRVHYASQ